MSPPLGAGAVAALDVALYMAGANRQEASRFFAERVARTVNERASS